MTHGQLVEKVARAIDPLAFVEGSPLADPEDAKRQARAAIAAIYEAMREPNAEMADAGEQAYEISVIRNGMTAAADAWKAMLDASPLKGE